MPSPVSKLLRYDGDTGVHLHEIAQRTPTRSALNPLGLWASALKRAIIYLVYYCPKKSSRAARTANVLRSDSHGPKIAIKKIRWGVSRDAPVAPPPPGRTTRRPERFGLPKIGAICGEQNPRPSRLCPVLCPPPNPTERDGVSQHRWKALLDKESVALRHNWSHPV